MSFKHIYIKQGREKSFLHRHPWIFSGAIEAIDADIENGEIVKVVNLHGNRLGYGFFSTQSQISCRVFEYENDYKEFTIDYWRNKFKNAFLLRQSCIDFSTTNSYRLLHAEGDFLPGVIADVYDKAVVMQILIRGTEFLLPIFKEVLLEMGFKYIYLKTKQTSQFLEGVSQIDWLTEPCEMPILIKENGIKIEVDFIKGQKTGFFIDQRDNRELVGSVSNNKNVLNTFSYTGGFSLYALKNGAKKVVSVDVSKDAIAMGDANAQLNNWSDRHESVAIDCFDYLKTMSDDFDVIVLDPPAFAKNAKAIVNAAKGYKEINMLALKKIKKGGILFTFSCSQNINKELFQKIVFGAAADAKRNVRIIRHLTQPADHPINIYHPEGEYLKGLMLWVE